MSNEETIGELSERSAHHYIEWKIPKFSSLSYEDSYKSQSFTLMNISSYLEIFLPDEDEDYDFVVLQIVAECEYPSDTTVSFRIKNHDSILIAEKSAFRPHYTYYAEFDFLDRATLQRKESEHLPEDSLTIVCDLKVNVDEKQKMLPAAEANTLKKISKHMRLTELDTLSNNLKSLFANKDSCDVILRVQDKEFNAHKIILKARSTVFASMFNHDTSENQTGIVTIPDCDADSFRYFLEFLYCGKLEDITFQNALHLYSISDKYNVQKLKCFCVEYMEQYLTENNVCDVIILADMHEESSLLTAAQDFFNNNAEKIAETTEWENLLKNNYRLANQVIKSMISKIKTSKC